MQKMKKIILIIAVWTSFIVVLAGCRDESIRVDLDETTVSTTQKTSLKPTITNITSDVFVHVTGYVKRPGVYKLSVGARIYEAVEKAGGFKKKAQKDALNLAETVVDGQKIYICSKKEYKKMLKSNGGNQGGVANANAGQGSGMTGNSSSSVEGQQSSGTGELVNINTATVEDFKTLSGIGDAKAQAIVDYRNENGNFTKVEDLTNVSGIGDATLAKIKERLTV